MISRLDHINIVVTDLQAAEEFFYLLGFVEKARGKLSGEWISQVVGLEDVMAEYVALVLPGDSVTVELLKYYSPSGIIPPGLSAPNATGYRHIAFSVSDIEAESQRLRASGVKLLSDVQIFPSTGKKLVYFLGPDGILLELAQYPHATI